MYVSIHISKTYNATACGIVDETMKAKCLKGADVRLNWMKDRVHQGQFHVHWEPANTNLGDYPTKHHSPTHHRMIRPIYLFDKALSPSTLQGCVNVLDSLAVNRRTPLTHEPAELPSRAINKTKVTNITGGTDRVKRIPSQTPHKIQSMLRKPFPRRLANERTGIQSIRPTAKYASKKIQRLLPPEGGSQTSEAFALKDIRRQ